MDTLYSISCQSYWSIKILIFDIVCESFLNCSWFNAAVTAYWKHLPALFFGFIVASLLFNQLEETVYGSPQFRLVY